MVQSMYDLTPFVSRAIIFHTMTPFNVDLFDIQLDTGIYLILITAMFPTGEQLDQRSGFPWHQEQYHDCIRFGIHTKVTYCIKPILNASSALLYKCWVHIERQNH